jgi:hypothetical protein
VIRGAFVRKSLILFLLLKKLVIVCMAVTDVRQTHFESFTKH